MERITLYPAGAEPVEVSFELQGRGEARTLRFETAGATIEGSLEALNAHQGTLRAENAVLPYFWARSGKELHLWIDGDTYVFELRDESQGGAAARPGSSAGGDVTAPMPGVIRKVLVTPGDAVEAAAPLLIMESMKMQISLPAPGAGHVTEVLCREGQMVDLGAVLVRLAPPEPLTGNPPG